MNWNIFGLMFGAFCLGWSMGGTLENYRARVNWKFPLGPQWKPPQS